MRNTERHSFLNRGFTLVEMAIVMVIIGLLVAAVAAGKQMINNGKIRSALKEIEEIQGAAVRFQESYNALPGDFQEASAYFGCTAGAAATGAGCDGDGDESLVWNIAASTTAFHEGATAYMHLQSASMMGGETLSGLDGWARPGINVPASKLTEGGYAMNVSNNRNWLILGTKDTSGADANSGVNDGAVLSPKNAANIDNKLDDGLPSTGRVRGFTDGDSGFTCLTGTPAQYNVGEVQTACYMNIMMDTSQP